MDVEEKVKNIMEEAVEELNEQLEDGQKITCSDDVRLIGKKATVSSIDFVTLITIIEELVSDKLDKEIMIVSDRAFSRERSPFYSIGTLTDFVVELLKEVGE